MSFLIRYSRFITALIVLTFILWPGDFVLAAKKKEKEENFFLDTLAYITGKYEGIATKNVKKEIDQYFKWIQLSPLEQLRITTRDVRREAKDAKKVLKDIEKTEDELFEIERKTSGVYQLKRKAENELKRISDAENLENKLDKIEKKRDSRITGRANASVFGSANPQINQLNNQISDQKRLLEQQQTTNKLQEQLQGVEGNLYNTVSTSKYETQINGVRDQFAQLFMGDSYQSTPSVLSAQNVPRSQSASYSEEGNMSIVQNYYVSSADVSFVKNYSINLAQSDTRANTDIAAYLDPDFILNNFEAQSIARGSIPEHFNILLDWLDAGIYPRDNYSYDPNASFLLLSPVDNDGFVEYIIVNDAYYHALPILENTYRDIKFIRADKAGTVLVNSVKLKGIEENFNTPNSNPQNKSIFNTNQTQATTLATNNPSTSFIASLLNPLQFSLTGK